MDILYFLGNGFDLAQSLKTQYHNFYSNYYTIKDADSDTIKKIKLSIANRIENWSDLEIAFGKYTKYINNVDELDEIYFNITDALRKYLECEQDYFKPNELHKEKALKDLCNPSIYLEFEDYMTCEEYIDLCEGRGELHINIITLNYTKTFEKLFDLDSTPLIIRDYNALLNNIIHLHGSVDGTILLGVNDKTQIGNEKFQRNSNAKDLLIKPQSNQAMKNDINVMCESFIDNAQILVIFGASLGETDKKWWHIIGRQFSRKDFILIYFHYDPKIITETNRQILLGRHVRNIKENLLNKFNIRISLKKEFYRRTFIAINQSVFLKRENRQYP